MRALAHWLLAAFMAVNLTWGHDWVHLPQLWWHFQEHRAEEGELSFGAFLAMHYADRDHAASDRDHQELPFQHHKDHGGVDHVFFAPVMKAGMLHPLSAAAVACHSADDPRDGFRPSTLQPPRA